MTPVDKDHIRREAIEDFVKELSPAIGISGFFITEKKSSYHTITKYTS